MKFEAVGRSDNAAGVAGSMASKVRESREARQRQADVVETALDNFEGLLLGWCETT